MSAPDFKCYDAATLDFDKLDPGIRETVRWLISIGFETTDSGDGEHKLAHGWSDADIVTEPHVYISAGRDLLDVSERLKRECERIGLVVQPCGRGDAFIQAMYDPADGSGTVGLFGVNDIALAGARSQR